MLKLSLLIVLGVICFQLVQPTAAMSQKRPGGRGNGPKPPREKIDRWSRNQQRGNFKRAAEGQVRERERNRTDREERRTGDSKPVDKADKWTRSQQKANFKHAVEGKTKEKREPDRKSRTGDVARSVDKATRWSRSQGKLTPGQHTKKFNEAGNPKSPPKGDGQKGKNGASGSAPPAGPPLKPPRP